MKNTIAWKMLVASSALAMTAGGAWAQEHQFTLHNYLSAHSAAHTEMLVAWADRVAEMSDGRIAREVYPNMTIGGTPPELVSQERDGVVDLIWTVAGYTPGLHPRSEVMELPGVFPGTSHEATLALHDMLDDVREDFGGLEVMWLHTHGGMAFHTA